MDLDSLWDDLLAAMQNRIGAQNVEIWLKSARPLAVDDTVLSLEVANTYYRDWIAEHYQGVLEQEASQRVGRPLQLTFVFPDEPMAATGRPQRVPRPAQERQSSVIGVNDTKTFQAFVEGNCNKLACAAAKAVADSPNTAYNPLYIHGATGLGKTHLMHAIGNAVRTQHNAYRVVYVTAEDFTNQMINGLRYKRMEEFRDRYRKQATVLLIDDIQFLSGKDRTQEEFFHTFNALQNSGGQIVLTSDVPPAEIDKLEPRLKTRFAGGLIADVHAPDKETLLAILRVKADEKKIELPKDLQEAVANRVAGNVRELEGLLNSLAATQQFHQKPLTLEFAREQLASVFVPPPAEVTVSGIIEAVARFHNLRAAEITGTRRTRTLTRPRHMAMYLARKHTNLSFPELGREFGGRDHSTIQHGFRKVEKELKDNADLDYKLRLIEKGLNVRSG